jgi:methyl-accepting chemotaxis protein
MISPIEILHRVRSFVTSSGSAREIAAIKESESAREIATIKQSEIDAIRRVRAMIECELDGTVRFANPVFLKVLGYAAEELAGQHHSVLVPTAFRSSSEYRELWAKLGRGEFQAGESLYVAKDGREVWLQGYYSPVFGAGGKPLYVVSYNTDVTAQVLFARQLQATIEQTQSAVKAALAGDLSQRISLDNKTGHMEALSRGINQLFDSINGVVNDINKVVDRAERHDLTARVETSGKTGAFGKLATGVNALIENTAALVQQMQSSASDVRNGAEEISTGNLNLSQRTEQQASSLEETAASMEEITATVRQTADNADLANELAMQAFQQAEKGGEVAAAAVSAMAGINASSSKIGDIIGVVNEIAFQTNLLALNAAVEAARAGEQGRGFAVVATEVRNLAGRSAAAAKEIKDLIQDSVKRVGDGSKLVDKSVESLNEIRAASQKVTKVVAEIAAAGREQAAGIEQVNQAITSMDQSTQQNAALVEQAAAASQSILEQANELEKLIAGYKIDPTADVAQQRQSVRDAA